MHIHILDSFLFWTENYNKTTFVNVSFTVKEKGFGISSSSNSLCSISLTHIAVLARPTENALAEVSANEIPTGVGVDTGVVAALVGIWCKRTKNEKVREIAAGLENTVRHPDFYSFTVKLHQWEKTTHWWCLWTYMTLLDYGSSTLFNEHEGDKISSKSKMTSSDLRRS